MLTVSQKVISPPEYHFAHREAGMRSCYGQSSFPSRGCLYCFLLVAKTTPPVVQFTTVIQTTRPFSKDNWKPLAFFRTLYSSLIIVYFVQTRAAVKVITLSQIPPICLWHLELILLAWTPPESPSSHFLGLRILSASYREYLFLFPQILIDNTAAFHIQTSCHFGNRGAGTSLITTKTKRHSVVLSMFISFQFTWHG